MYLDENRLHLKMILSVTGSSGIPVKIITNLFGLWLPSGWQMYQYRVEFSPELESRRLRLALLYSHPKFQLKAKAFDGATLFLTEKLESNVSLYVTQYFNKRSLFFVLEISLRGRGDVGAPAQLHSSGS